MPETSWSGNKGEWGEAFVLMHLLANNDLYGADEDGRRVEAEHSRVRAIYRSETSGCDLAFMVLDGTDPDGESSKVLVLRDNEPVVYVDKSELGELAHSLFVGLSTTNDREYPDVCAYLQSLGLEALKAGSRHKADLRARVLDGFVGMELTRSYSIKSLFGASPSLSNASGQAIFRYRLPGFDGNKAAEVMAIDSSNAKAWVVERLRRCMELADGPLQPNIPSHTFKRNLLKCHWLAPTLVPYALLYGQLIRGKRIPDALAAVKAANPAGLPDTELDDYDDAVRRYLWAIVFDMDPGSPWKGPIQVDGYLITGLREEVLAYQVSRQQSFENYLLAHAKFDTPSSSRHGIASVCQDGEGYYIDLACVVKYDAKRYEGPSST